MEYTSQNDLLLNKLMEFYKQNDNLNKMLNIINGSSNISLRIEDWYVTNYAKKNFTTYEVNKNNNNYRLYDISNINFSSLLF